MDYSISIYKLFDMAVSNNASDLHLVSGEAPHVRIYGKLTALDLPVLTSRNIEGLVYSILDRTQIEVLEFERELDFSYYIPSLARFRGSAMYERGGLAVTFRIIPLQIPDIEELGLPKGIENLCELKDGLVLITGPVGSGKSTTIAAIIDLINRTKKVNIITIEDPIEFVHSHKRSIIRQREVGLDTHSFSKALRHVLRHDPDILFIGEMRDSDSVSAALTAAETGHLVFSTLHTPTTFLTINRIIDMFHPDQREQVRQQLADSIEAIISQRLIPYTQGEGRVLAAEIMLSNSAVRNIIRENRGHQLYTTIQTSTHLGMQTMDQALASLYLEGIIKIEDAFKNCIDRRELERLIGENSI